MHSDERVRASRSKSHCNAHTCLAYCLSLVASVTIVHGFYLYVQSRNKTWLALPLLGVLLILLGSCLYRCGARRLYTANFGVARRNRVSKGTGGTFFESQLSLNMLPQCFSNTNSSRVFSSNGHRYLSLPADSQAGHSNEIRMQSLAPSSDDETNKPNPNKSNSNANILTEQEASQSTPRVTPVESLTSPCEPVCDAAENSTQVDSSLPAPQQLVISVQMSQADCHTGASSREDISLVDNEELSHNEPPQNSLLALDRSESDENATLSSEDSPANELPPSYDSIDFDSSDALVNNYRTL